MLITYTRDSEVLVTTTTREAEFLGEWFGKKMRRELEDYDRQVHTNSTGVKILSRLRLE